MAAQLAHYMRLELDVDALVEGGESGPIREWLREKVWRHGSGEGSMDELLERAVGERLNERYYLDYLREKYEDIYGL